MSCSFEDIFDSVRILPWKKIRFTLNTTIQDLLSSWWQAVNHQSSHKATHSLPIHPLPWDCYPHLHGNLKTDTFHSAVTCSAGLRSVAAIWASQIYISIQSPIHLANIVKLAKARGCKSRHPQKSTMWTAEIQQTYLYKTRCESSGCLDMLKCHPLLKRKERFLMSSSCQTNIEQELGYKYFSSINCDTSCDIFINYHKRLGLSHHSFAAV